MVSEECFVDMKWITLGLYFLGAFVGFWMGVLWKESKIRHELKTPKSRKVSNGK